MTVENSDYIAPLIFLMGAMLLLQSAFLAIVAFRSRRLLGTMDRKLERTHERVLSAVRALQKLAFAVAQVPEALPAIEAKIDQTSGVMQKGLSLADSAFVSSIRQLKHLMTQADSLVDRELRRFSYQTYRVHRSITDPAIRVSALAKGIQAALTKYLTGRRNDSPASVHPDRDLFI